MLSYWLLFAFFAVGAMISPLQRPPAYVGPDVAVGPPERLPFRLFFLVGSIATIFMIGLRFEVGADWWNYLIMYNTTSHYGLIRAIERGDPGFQLINWIASTLGLAIWFVNLVAGAVFGWGLYRLCSVQPLPWLAFAIAVPYMVVVVAMGYTRQSMALGVLMAGLAKQSRGGSILNFAIYVAVAATFHKTAVALFPIVAISAKGNRFLNLLILLSTSILLYDSFLGDSMDNFVKNYIDRGYDSQGAGIRVAMNMVPAVLFWVFKSKLEFRPIEYVLWRNFALASLAFAILLFVLPSSTVVDRMSLYLMPLQIAVLTRVAILGESRIPGTTAVLVYLFTVQFVWLNFAAHARYWVPYRLYPF